jgi:hypothetical protein
VSVAKRTHQNDENQRGLTIINPIFANPELQNNVISGFSLTTTSDFAPTLIVDYTKSLQVSIVQGSKSVYLCSAI